MAKSTGSKGFLFGALAGVVVGSVTALLFAPKAGKELRHDIAEGAQKVGDTTARIASQVGQTTGRIAKQVGSSASEVADRAKSAAAGVVTSVRSWRGGEERVEAELEKAIISSLTAGIASSENELVSDALEALEPETEQVESIDKTLQTIG
ncbi:general stress protein [Paenibacillus curdlanolyticus YK9]|uniref:General stress protein n=1 Tax=Paenibacillus curdlanolyticus YK9 TaxID=717606 RepID=E0I4U4_9BACL|nr:YtxH domain-containing protein [Paenibacillus curdlanolyticus]EFM12625.1 general stress protein [Paenibacillus curdlanolyticus YK9]